MWHLPTTSVNEWLDRESDKFHPTKSNAVRRAEGSAQGDSSAGVGGIVGVGLICALIASVPMFLVACAFALQGVIYNVPPLRTKEIPYFDVISELINNPLR